jgi:hypothetical protein
MAELVPEDLRGRATPADSDRATEIIKSCPGGLSGCDDCDAEACGGFDEPLAYAAVYDKIEPLDAQIGSAATRAGTSRSLW